MTDSYYFKANKFFKIWFTFITVVILLSMLFFYIFEIGSIDLALATIILIPFGNFFLVLIYSFIYGIIEDNEKGENSYLRYDVNRFFSIKDKLYIKDNYPKIYAEFASNERKIKSMKLQRFLRGIFDDGELTLIQNKLKLKQRIILFSAIECFTMFIVGFIFAILKS